MGIVLDADELRAQHPELRLELIPSEQAGRHLHSRSAPGTAAYEWWQVEAFDESGSGVRIELANGDPFDLGYRASIRRHGAGAYVEPALLGPTAYPAVRISLLRRHQLVARVHDLYDRGDFAETVGPGDDDWGIAIRHNTLRRRGESWTLQAYGAPTEIGWRGLVQPGAIAGGRLSCSLNIQPRFRTTTVRRAFLPDSPQGATHDWFLACPAASVTGEVRLSVPGRDEIAVQLQQAPGAIDHFNGSGLIGRGMRRWYRTRLIWEDGAVVAETPTIRKYIQLAGTLMLFRPDEIPMIVRSERGPTPSFQRSSWLLAYPSALIWSDRATNTTLSLAVEHLHDSMPHRSFSLAQMEFETGQAPRELVVGPAAGVFEMLQPGRLDWWLWRRWLRSNAAGATECR